MTRSDIYIRRGRGCLPSSARRIVFNIRLKPSLAHGTKVQHARRALETTLKLKGKLIVDAGTLIKERSGSRTRVAGFGVHGHQVASVLEDLETKLRQPFNRFSDTLAADEVELNFKYVIQFSLCRRQSYAGHPPVKSAILARDSTMIHYARLHALLTQGSPINVRVFKDRKEAADWLNVPVERLTQNA